MIYDENGEITTASYYQNDKLHRLDGPATLGNMFKPSQYWKNGINYTKQARNIIKELGISSDPKKWTDGERFNFKQMFSKE